MTPDERDWLRSVGMVVRLARVARLLSQEQFADLADVGRATLGSVERGDHPAGIITYWRVAAALDVPLDDLLP